MAPSCNRFYLVQPGDSCWAITNSANIPLSVFYTLNPSVGTECTGLLSGFYVCLGLVADGAPGTTIATGPPIAATPSPVQEDMERGCTRFYLVQSGDSCAGIVSSVGGIGLGEFLGWNPAVGTGCEMLLSGFYVCVGMGGGGTTIGG